MPGDVGYGMVACSGAAIEKAFRAKRRAPHKKHAMVGSYLIHREIHDMSTEQFDMVTSITQDHDLPLGVIAKYRPDHPTIKNIDPQTLQQCTQNGTISILVGAGLFQEQLAKLTHQANIPLIGSSANLTGQGSRFRVEDIEPEIKVCADIIIDYGLCKYFKTKRSSTLFDFNKMEVVRIGSVYECVQDVFKRYWGVDLPDDPGQNVLPSGHMREDPRVH